MIELVLRVNDPLAAPGSLCRDALKTAADLDILLNRPCWRRVEEVIRQPRAWGLLNLCDAALDEVSPYSAPRRAKLREIRPRVKLAAVTERNSRSNEIERVSAMRDAAIPNLWSLLERYVEDDKARMARRHVC